MSLKNDITQLPALRNLPVQKQEEVLKRLEKLIHKRIAIKISERLIDQNIEDREGNEAILEMLKSKISDFDDLIARTSADTVNEFMSSINARTAHI